MTRIFVGNLSYQTSEADLERAFARYGRVSSVRMVTDRASGAPRGFAFVQMPGIDDAEEAIARMNGQLISGRAISVSEARDRDDGRTPQSSGPSQAPRRSALLDRL
ncbi:MAG: RNA-binding protein [Planctomycetaceae bacterium]|nr:RNA-binding protein [Planctomycetaceae bacterium]